MKRSPDILAAAVVMETFLTRERMSFKKRESTTTHSIYYEIRRAKRNGYFLLRISDHRQPLNREPMKFADVEILSINHITHAQKRITANCKRNP